MTKSSTATSSSTVASDAPPATPNNNNNGGRSNINNKQKKKKKWMSIALLHSALVFIQIGTSGYQVITRIALTSGMNLFVFAFYRGAIGLCFLIPIAFFVERLQMLPLSWNY